MSGIATLYRREAARKPLATVTLERDAGGLGGYTVAPKGAHWYTAEITCEPDAPIYRTFTFTGAFVAGQTARVDCPAETPYLWSVASVYAIDPAGGSPLALGYSVAYDDSGAPVGIEFSTSFPGWNWQTTITALTSGLPSPGISESAASRGNLSSWGLPHVWDWNGLHASLPSSTARCT